MPHGAGHRHAGRLSHLFDSVGTCGIQAQHADDGDDVNALSFYCGSHDTCLDPVGQLIQSGHCQCRSLLAVTPGEGD